MRYFLLIIISLFLFAGTSVSGAELGLNDDGFQEFCFEKEELSEMFSDDLLIVRKNNVQQQSSKFISSKSTHNTSYLIAFDNKQDALIHNYNILTTCKQEVCFGLLFLQQLF